MTDTNRRIEAVVFDMDGLLVDSETYWEEARASYARSRGCDWRRDDELNAKGKNSREWATLIVDRCAPDTPVDDVIAGVVERMRALYALDLRLLPGAVEAVRRVAGRYPTGLASSSPPALIDDVLRQAGIRSEFAVTVSSDEVGRGKPSPDVFLEAARRLNVTPAHTLVFEDSSQGIHAAYSAGMRVVAVPNPHFPPSREALDRAILLPSLSELTDEWLAALSRRA